MNSKGMVYTTFAIVATSMLVLLVSFTAIDSNYTSDTNPFRIGQASFYLDNVESDLSRAYTIAFQRGTSGAINYIVETGNETENPTQALRNATVRGVISGYDLENTENATLTDWKERVEEAAGQSKYSLSIEYTDMEVEDDYMQLQGNITTFMSMKDPVSLARFNSTREYSTTHNIEGLEDPMILLRTQGRYISTFEACGFNRPAEPLANADGNETGPTYGEATFNQGAANKSTKILVTETSPPSGQAGAFAGIVTQADELNGFDGERKTVKGLSTSEYDRIDPGMNLILADDQVWNSHIRNITNSRCYMKTTESPSLNQVGPGFLERTQNELQADEQQGLTTFLDKPDLPTGITREEGSNVAHVYFSNEDYGTTTGIQGVTGDQAYDSTTRDYRESFRLNQQHLEHWNITGLAY